MIGDHSITGGGYGDGKGVSAIRAFRSAWHAAEPVGQRPSAIHRPRDGAQATSCLIGRVGASKLNVQRSNGKCRLKDGSYRWPFALQPIRTWIIRDAPEFRDLPGYTPATHTQRAITTVQEVGEELAATLKDLLQTNGEELEVMTPRYLTMASRVQQLRQKHPFALNGYSVQPNTEATNSIYIATLGKGGRTLKIGHAQDAANRVAEFNKYRLSSEPQWTLHTDQAIGSVQDAIEIEKYLGEVFAKYRTEPNNNEVYVGLDAIDVALKLATAQVKK